MAGYTNTLPPELKKFNPAPPARDVRSAVIKIHYSAAAISGRTGVVSISRAVDYQSGEKFVYLTLNQN